MTNGPVRPREDADALAPRLFLSDVPSGDLEPGSRVSLHVGRLEKINAALMRRVERSMDHHGNAYTLFQAAIVLEDQVRARTDELSAALRALETSNRNLIRANEIAERSNASKTRFLAAASHDLLQPLNAARLALAALSEERMAAPARRLMQQVDRSMTNVEELLRSLFVISKLDAGATVPMRAPVSIARLFDTLQSDFHGEAARKQLRLHFRALPLLVDSDPIFLRRILQNLTSNAVRYTESGAVLVACRRRGGALRIEVRDSGIGIPTDQQERIFDEFFRGPPAQETPSEGLGLGLAIVKRMAEALDHRIEFQSSPGRGSTFAVTLPIETSKPAASGIAPGAAWAAAGFANATVAVIENDRDAITALERLLEKWSCQPISAVNGEEMLSRLADRRIDLVLADFHLDGGVTGVDAVVQLRARFGPELPAVIITADYSKDVEAKVKAAGCEMMTKPARPAELRALLTHLLAQRGQDR